MSQAMPNPSDDRTGATPGIQNGTGSTTYREGLEKAMTVVWREKNKHSVISETYFALKKVWDELYAESAASEPDKK
jgi:hypothetical protein